MNAPIPLTSEQPPKASESATVTLINVAELAKGNMDLIKCLMQTITNYQNTHGLCINGQGLTVCSNKPFKLIISYKEDIVKKEILLRNHIDSAEGTHSEKYFHLYTWGDIQNLFTDQKFTLNKGDSIAIKLQFQDGACHEQLVVFARDLVNSLTVIANNPDHKLLRVFKDIQTLIDKPEHLAIALLNVLTLNPFYPQPFKLNADGTATLNVDARTAALTTFLLESLSITPTAQKLDKRAILKLTAPETKILLNCLTASDVHPKTDAARQLQVVLKEMAQQVIKPANPLAGLDTDVIDAASTEANDTAGTRAEADAAEAKLEITVPPPFRALQIQIAVFINNEFEILFDHTSQVFTLNASGSDLNTLQNAFLQAGITTTASGKIKKNQPEGCLNITLQELKKLDTLLKSAPRHPVISYFINQCYDQVYGPILYRPVSSPTPPGA